MSLIGPTNDVYSNRDNRKTAGRHRAINGGMGFIARMVARTRKAGLQGRHWPAIDSSTGSIDGDGIIATFCVDPHED